MSRRECLSFPPQRRRITVTLPEDSLAEAQRIAHSRKVTLSTVIAEALHEGLRLQKAAAQIEEVLQSYKRAFSGFADEEVSILDGVILKPAPRH